MSGETIRRFHQCIHVFDLEGRVPRGGIDGQLTPRPGLVQFPGVLERTDHVVSALHDHAGNVFDAMCVAQELALDLEEAAVDEVMILDAGKCQGELGILVSLDEILINVQVARRPLPHAPRACSREADLLIIGGKAPVESRDQIVSFHDRDCLEVGLPRVGEHVGCPFLVEPLQLPAPQHEYAA